MCTTPPGSAVDAVKVKVSTFPGLTLNRALSAGVGDVQSTLAESARPAEATSNSPKAAAANAARNDLANEETYGLFTILLLRVDAIFVVGKS
jgi:hypothetical protein